MGTRTGLTAPREGVDARVGREMGRDWGWVLARTQRAERLLAQPAIMAKADEIAMYVLRYCRQRGTKPKHLDPDLAPTRTKTYITIRLNAIPCVPCNGTGLLSGTLCGRCGGSGYRND